MIVRSNYFSEGLLLPPANGMTESENLATDLDATLDTFNTEYILFDYQIHYNKIVF